MMNQSSILDISVGETYRLQGQFANALVPIPEDCSSPKNATSVADGEDAQEKLRETLTRGSSNCFYRKSPKLASNLN